jgi:ADP-heptose:LPS heptosyltransferase
MIKKTKNSIDLSKANKILFLRKDNKIGYMLVNTIAFRELKKVYPDIKIEVVCGKDSAEIISESPYVNEVYIFQKGILKEQKLIKKLKSNKYDILIDLSEQTTFDKLMYIGKIGADVNIGFKKSEYKLYDISIENDFSAKHEFYRYFELLKIFNIESFNNKYDIFLNKKYIAEAENRIKNFKGINVILNRYGANKHRTFNEENMKKITDKILNISSKINIILLYPPFKEQESINFAKKYKNNRLICFKEMKSIMESAALIKNSDVVITPETAIVHIACALNTNLVSIYRNSKEKVNEWGPISDKAVVVMSDNKKDINDIEIEKIIIEIKNFLGDKIER